jgi:carbamoyltransferase
MRILGISAFYHDSSACLIEDGRIIAAVQEERFTRIKHDSGFPVECIKYCLKEAGLAPEQVDAIVFYEKPFLKFERLLETYLAFAPRGFVSFGKAIPLWLNEKLFQKKLLREELEDLGFSKQQGQGVLFSSHHLSHAASAFYASPYHESIVLTMDGVGEWDTTTVYIGKGRELTKELELHFPHSLGLLYSAFTYYCGFKVNSGEYKLMGLAPYGNPRFAEKIRQHLVDIKEDGSFRLNLEFFDYCTGLTMTNKKFDDLFENNYRAPESKLEQVHMDLAASIQLVLEEIVIKICHHLSSKYKINSLCLAGGVALNCVANGKIHRQNLFKNGIWVQPAAGDAGGSLGAALAAYHLHFQKDRVGLNGADDLMQGSYLGPRFEAGEIENFLKSKNAKFFKLSDPDLNNFVVEQMTNDKVVGWFQGRMEYGPRALGARSIIADSRSQKMQKTLNLKIKFRESFRPFAPAVLAEDVSTWFDYDQKSPYMLMVAGVHPEKRLKQEGSRSDTLKGIDLLNESRSQIPSVTHVDYSARIQTVHAETNPRFYSLIQKFKEKTGVPVLVNTSFNIRGEPIVCSPSDAYKCFMGTYMDVLVLENFVLIKEEQPTENAGDYKHLFQLD